jgi:hypothetical protein
MPGAGPLHTGVRLNGRGTGRRPPRWGLQLHQPGIDEVRQLANLV